MAEPSDDEKRRRVAYAWKRRDEVARKLMAEGMDPLEVVKRLPIPECFPGLMCGARTRAGTPCKSRAIYTNGRCKNHGGMSTGPKTEAGREQSRVNGRKGGPHKPKGEPR